MVTKFSPEINKVYFINQYTLLHILDGNGSIEVDFRHYYDWPDKLIYLEKGQYIKFLSDNFVVRKMEFPDEETYRNKEVRVLFKHLVSLGYINFTECADCQKYLSNTAFSSQASDIIDISSRQWYWQNPFHANKEEYHLIFDVKELIDREYHQHLTNDELTHLIQDNGYQAQALVKDKVGISIKGLLSNKRLLESKKEVAFTDKSMQEIAFDMGYKDPAYFNRAFKNTTGKTPLQFRDDFDYEYRDRFMQDLLELLKKYHTQQRELGFYADKMHLSVKTLSKKVRGKLNVSLGQLIRYELTQTAKRMLLEEPNIKEVALNLGFEEPNHFSAFFKHHTGLSPSQYLAQKYNQ